MEVMRQVLEALAAGRDVRGSGFTIDNNNRGAFHALLRMLYLKDVKSASSAQMRNVAVGAVLDGAGRGRKKKPIDEIRYEYAVQQFRERQITASEAAKKAGMSRATFFRRLKEERGIRPTKQSQEGDQ